MPSLFTLSMYALATILSALNLAALGLKYVASVKLLQRALDSYSFQDDDYPPYYPITLPAVLMSAEDSVHYDLWANDTSLEMGAMFPQGGGFVYLGASKRPFGVALYHQMHCMTMVAQAFYDASKLNSTTHKISGHTDHCFDYIRHAILCAADITLEPAKVDGSIDIGESRVCKDWSFVRSLIDKNHEHMSMLGDEHL